MRDDDDIRKKLDETRSAFRKGLAGVTLIAEKNQADVERAHSEIDKFKDALQTVTRLDERVPTDIKERLAKLENAAEITREDTQRVRLLQLNEAGEITKDKRESSKWAFYGMVGAAIASAIAAVIAAVIAAKGG